MKIGNNFFGLKISATGLSVERKKMNLIAENIANSSTTKTSEGGPYKRKVLSVKAEKNPFSQALDMQEGTLRMQTTNNAHFLNTPGSLTDESSGTGVTSKELNDPSQGDVIYMPDHPDADEKGYVKMPNVNIITEMTDMIAASRSYEANLTALNSSKQMAKDSLEI
ncbi:MAG: flagellar basal body rod protein FlgC [Bacteroidota bacterium]